MGFDSKGGFHSGHTQALDLGDLDKNVDRDDEWKVGGKGKTGWDERRRVSGWAAEEEGWGDFGDEGGGGGGGGGGGHTAALDIEELREGGDFGGGGGRRSGRGGGGGGGRSSDFDRPSGRGGGGGGGWADDHEDDLEDDWGGKGGGRSSGGGGRGGGGWDAGGGDDAWDNFGGGGGGGHTAALDLQDFDSGPKAKARQQTRGRERGRHGELLDELENREEKIRYEDSRGESAGEDRKGRKSYSAGQGAKGASAERDASAERARDASERQRSRAEQDLRKLRVELDPDEPMMPLPGGPRHESTPGELAPHERTMALDVDAMRGAAPAPAAAPSRRPSSSMDLPRTQALEIEDLRRGASAQPVEPPAELAPHERTHALDLSSLGVGAIPATQALRPVSGARPADPLKTSTIDPSELESFRLNEASSGAQLLIFVEGTEPIAFELRPGVTNIGRDRSNHLVLADPHVSRKHLRIKKNNDNTFEIREQSPENRILLNGQPCQDTLLHQSDEIQIGSTVMRFILGRPGAHDWTWPAKVHPPQSGHTASVRVPEELLMEPEPSSAKAPPRKANKALIAVLVAFILGTLGLLALAVAYVLWGDKLLGG